MISNMGKHDFLLSCHFLLNTCVCEGGIISKWKSLENIEARMDDGMKEQYENYAVREWNLRKTREVGFGNG